MNFAANANTPPHSRERQWALYLKHPDTCPVLIDHWSEVIADPVIADAIRDRLQHSALTVTITGESYRGVKARKLAARNKDG
jgi:hypothetical protein